ncbi:hypothetical protein ACF8OH_27190 [Delftia sp. WSY_9]|uniref:hypothetical protein n=1 Tax=unclassified Delftia TaxID=2613839 RepID=UPI00370AA839
MVDLPPSPLEGEFGSPVPVTESTAARDTAEFPGGLGRGGFNLDCPGTGVTDSVVGEDAQNALVLANIEARLAQEVRGLIGSLDQFGRSAQGIYVEIPDGAHFCKAITSFLALLSLQIAYALTKGLDKSVFFDDGAQYLRELDLDLGEFVRELTLDGRRFLAVALVDQQATKFDGSADRADE